MAEPIHQCANCLHYQLKMLGEEVNGKCYRYPPKAIIVPTKGGPVTATFWPGPKPVEHCGEWKARIRIANDN